MKKPAAFTNHELINIERAVNARINILGELGPNNPGDHLVTLLKARQKIWEQLHGTEATDVEGIWP